MYLNDAQDVAVPRKKQEPPKLDPKLVAWYEERKGGGGHTVGPRQSGFMAVCKWTDGYHTCYDYGGSCPRDMVREGQEEPISFLRRVG